MAWALETTENGDRAMGASRGGLSEMFVVVGFNWRQGNRKWEMSAERECKQ